MGLAANEPNISEEFFRGGFTNEGSADGGVLQLKNMTGLWILQECVRIWEAGGQHHPWAELEEVASKASAFQSFIDPAASQLQSPPDMDAALKRYCANTGQTVPETPAEIARCVFESLSLSYRFLCQMTADACGREVIAGPVEAAALGNAMVQAVATGHVSNLADGRAALKRSVHYESYSPARGSAWEEAFEQYKAVVALGHIRCGP
jgi:sugar (pentulose or hexulose) kinase